jgi:hypothetical protein
VHAHDLNGVREAVVAHDTGRKMRELGHHLECRDARTCSCGEARKEACSCADIDGRNATVPGLIAVFGLFTVGGRAILDACDGLLNREGIQLVPILVVKHVEMPTPCIRHFARTPPQRLLI